MKKIILLLAIAVATCPALAQELECTFCGPKRQSKTQAHFNASYINHRHIVALEKGNKMIIEMFNIHDYDVLQDIGSIFGAFRDSMVPFTDSLQSSPLKHMRIDYAYSTAADYRKIRIKKHDPDGDIFLGGNGEISRLKVEQDTIRILIEKKAYFTTQGVEYKNYRPVQITLLLNNYTDIDYLLEKKGELQHFIDTMAKVAIPTYDVWSQNYKTTIIFHPYPGATERFSGKFRFIFFDGILTDEYNSIPWESKLVFPRAFAFVADMGIGLVGSKLSPMADLGFEYRLRKMRGGDMTMFRATLAPYFLFGKTATGKVSMHDNWFVNAEIGRLIRNEGTTYLFQRKTIGVGYLLRPDGNYLKGATLKAFIRFPLPYQFALVPEVIVTNDFKTVFPAVTLKGFLTRE